MVMNYCDRFPNPAEKFYEILRTKVTVNKKLFGGNVFMFLVMFVLQLDTGYKFESVEAYPHLTSKEFTKLTGEEKHPFNKGFNLIIKKGWRRYGVQVLFRKDSIINHGLQAFYDESKIKLELIPMIVSNSDDIERTPDLHQLETTRNLKKCLGNDLKTRINKYFTDILNNLQVHHTGFEYMNTDRLLEEIENYIGDDEDFVPDDSETDEEYETDSDASSSDDDTPIRARL
jgi:hypothetical protein